MELLLPVLCLWPDIKLPKSTGIWSVTWACSGWRRMCSRRSSQAFFNDICGISPDFKKCRWEVEEQILARWLMYVSVLETRWFFLEWWKYCATLICFYHSKTSPFSSMVYNVSVQPQLISSCALMLGEGGAGWRLEWKTKLFFPLLPLSHFLATDKHIPPSEKHGW